MTSKELDTIFAWNIGHYVFVRAEVQRWNEITAHILDRVADPEVSAVLRFRPSRFCIIGRHIEEYHAGLQWYYTVRIGNKVHRFFEFELSGFKDEKP